MMESILLFSNFMENFMRISRSAFYEPTKMSPEFINEMPAVAKMLEADRLAQKPPSNTKIFFNDFVTFLNNFCFWPIHGHVILMHHLFLILLLPLFLPYLILAEIVQLIFSIFTCGC